jgi:cyanophycinase-like exopeptidase
MTTSPLDISKGTLALVGSGEYLPGMDPVDRQLLDRLGGSPRVVCLPTAAGDEGPESVGKWSRMGVEHFTRLGTQVEAVEVINRKTADDERLADKIRAANFVYLSGGDPAYLHKVLKDTRSWEAITNVLAEGGVVAGCSAGAMIWGEKIPSFPILLPFHSVFNYLPGAIIMPHFDEFGDRWGGALKMIMGDSTILGVDGYTALVCRQDGYAASGSGGVTVWNKKRRERFTDGQSVEWQQ